MFGRRDRCLLALPQLAGVPYKHLATMTAGDITLTDGVATITSPAGRWSLLPNDDALLCGPCAIARWVRVVDLAVTKISTNVLKAAVGKTERLTDASPHLCRSNKKLNKATTTAPLIPPINQWGALPFPLEPMTPHSLSQRVRDILAGDLGAHRDLPVNQDDVTEKEIGRSSGGSAGGVQPGGFASSVESSAYRPTGFIRRQRPTRRHRPPGQRTQPACGSTA